MRKLADRKQVDTLIDTLGQAIKTRMAKDAGDWAIVGIRSRGDVLAARLVQKIGSEPFQGRVGAVDITLYRDDLSEIGAQPIVRTTDIPFDIDGLNIVLVDDVLMTGRSVRAALQSLMDIGRPKRVWLAVLVDRGGRELPIRADDVALNLTTTGDNELSGKLTRDDRVQVTLTPGDEDDAIFVKRVPASDDMAADSSGDTTRE